MKFDSFEGKCEKCGEKKFVIVPHQKEGNFGICWDCYFDLDTE